MAYGYHDDAGHFGGTYTPLKSGEVLAIDPANIVPPFEIRRVYWIYKTVAGMVRGRHAHKALWQLLSCPIGSCIVMLEDRDGRKDYILDCPEKGLLVGPGVWREMSGFSPDCVLTVLASLPYDETDYIRDYDEWLGDQSMPGCGTKPRESIVKRRAGGGKVGADLVELGH